LPELLRDQEQTNGLQVLPILRDDIFKLSDFPNHHRDPFDRLIAAQALRRGYQIVTHDPLIAQYGVPVLW
jgi:PIN domain nuclease of toxin-antitoxin system